MKTMRMGIAWATVGASGMSAIYSYLILDYASAILATLVGVLGLSLVIDAQQRMCDTCRKDQRDAKQ